MLIILSICVIGLAFYLQNRYYRKHMFDRLSYRCYFSADEVFEGDELTFTEEIENGKSLPIPWLRSDFTTSSYLEFAQSRSVITDNLRYVVSFFLLRGHQKVTRSWSVVCKKRGIYNIDAVSLSGADILGGDLISKSFHSPATLTVLPSPAKYSDIPLHLHHQNGEIAVKRHLVADPFCIAGSREYVPGDNANHINWKQTARMQKLMVQEYGYTTSSDAAVILNIQSREQEWTKVVDEENVENAIRLCASLFSNTMKLGIPVSFATNAKLVEGKNVFLPSAFGYEHTLSLLRTMSALPLYKSMEFDDYLKTECSAISASDIYVVTSYINEAVASYAIQHPNVHLILTGKRCEKAFLDLPCVTDLSILFESEAENA